MMDYFYCIESPTRARPFQCFKSYSFSLKKQKTKNKTGSLRKQPLLAQQSSISVRYA